MGEILERMMLIALSMILLSTLFPIINNMKNDFQIYSINEKSNSIDLIENDIEDFNIKLNDFFVNGVNHANCSFNFDGKIGMIISETLLDSIAIIFRFSSTSLNHPIYKTIDIQEKVSISVLSIEVRQYSIISKNGSGFIYFY